MQQSFFTWLGKLRFVTAIFCPYVIRKINQTEVARFLLTATAVLVMTLLSTLPARAAQQTLKGRHVPPITKQLVSKGRLESGRQINLSIGLPLRNHDQLTNLLQELYQPGSSNFHHYLSADEFASKYGPSEEDYQSVIRFAKSHGLTVTRTHGNRTLLNVSGSVSDVEKAFHVHMHTYQHPKEARTFFAPDVEPTLDLLTPVLAISGLDSFVKPRPQIHSVRPLGGGLGGGGGGGGSGSGGSFIGYDFRGAYAPGVSLDGTGQSVGLFELTGYDPDDISDYEDEAGLPNVPLQDVYIDDFDGDDSNYEYAIEATADIEMAIAMAPGLDSVIIYEGPTPQYDAPIGTNATQYAETTAQINDVLNRMATDNLAKQLSSSYLMDINLSTVQIFEQFAAQGQSFFQGSGDFGAYAGAIDNPADDPYLTIVGGTTLTISGTEGLWHSETVWLTPASSDPLDGNTPEAASGGGVSLVYKIPTWQQGISMTANQGSTTMRNLPDVALVANNIDVVWGNDLIGSSLDLPEAGTSLATPLWAGFMALVNQQAAANGQPPVGFINPTLYAIAKSSKYLSCFHDITTGNDFNTSSPNKFRATVGYDLCTGWGTIIGSNLITALLNPPKENLLVTPPFGFTSSGPGGGPFSVTSQTYTLSNSSSSALSWSLVNTSSWLNVSATSGTLNPGATATVQVSLNSTANGFLIAAHSGNVLISNLTDGTAQNRQFDLYVGNGGFESGDLTGWNFNGDTNLVFALAADDLDVGGINALDGQPDVQFVHSGLYGAYLGQYPTDGSLAQTFPTKTGQRYLISFSLASIPSQGDTTPNDFAASWNGTTLFSQSDLPAFSWTNMQFVVSAASTSSTLEFDFNNEPGAFGLDDVIVETLPPPVLQSAVVTGSSLNFSFNGIANISYQIQSTTNLFNPNWTNVAAPIVASNDVVNATAPTGAAPQLFYRVIMLPNP